MMTFCNKHNNCSKYPSSSIPNDCVFVKYLNSAIVIFLGISLLQEEFRKTQPFLNKIPPPVESAAPARQNGQISESAAPAR